MSNRLRQKIGSQYVGQGELPLFLPDIDVYFKDDIDGARRLVNELSALGVSTLKGAILHDAEICLPGGDTGYYVPGEGVRTENYRAVIDRHVVPLETFRRIYSGARDKGLDLVLSVYDEPGIALAIDLDSAALKIPSSNITHAPLIRDAASAGLPLIIDTGRSTMDEISRAVGWARKAGVKVLIIEHSPPGPPAPVSAFNLNMMTALGEDHNCFDGLSDHFIGIDMMLVAAARGADVIEKGVCLDQTKSDIDIAHALPISQVGYALEKIKLYHQSLGVQERVLPADRPFPPDRMCVVAATDLVAGTPITRKNVRFAFPPLGIGCENWDIMEGRSVKRFVPAGQPLQDDDI
ncbi:MAG: N-acetylneuraminate synthase family protein [Allorhizobium sp.]